MTSEDRVDEQPHGERLPWLQKIEGEQPRSGGDVRRLLAYAGGLFLVLALVVGGVLIFSDRNGVRAPPGGELAGLDGAAAPIASPREVDASAPARHHKARHRRADAPSAKRETREVRPKRETRDIRQPHDARETRETHEARQAGEARRPKIERQAAAAGPSRRGPAAGTALGQSRQQASVSPPATRPARAGAVVQLGAFSSRARAERAWRQARGAGRPAGARHWIEPVRIKGELLYRLRVEAPSARVGCGPAPRAARSRCSCFVVPGRAR